jgi:starch synthase
LFGIVTRLAAQKGTGLMREGLPRALRGMGSSSPCWARATPTTRTSSAGWRGIPRAGRGGIGYSDELAHRIQAGADFFLMPSLFEPAA